MAFSSSSLLRMDEIAGKGKGLVAAQSLKAGQVVLRESPLIIYSSSPLISTSSSPSSHFPYCDHCFRTLPTNSIPCPSCSYHHFCSYKCFSTALNTFHSSLVCQALTHLRDTESLQQQPSERQVQARFVVAAYNLAIISPSGIHAFLSLHGTPDDSIIEAAKFLHSLISPLFPSNINISVDLTAKLLAKDRINSFCLMNPYSPDGPQRSIKAYAIYPKASMFNHDCIPNACRFDYVDTTDLDDEHNNTDIVIRMIEDVAEGREVCISYFRISRDYCTRKRILMDDYGFTCECDRCKIEANWAQDCQNYVEEYSDLAHVRFITKYVCHRKNCNGTLAPKDDVHTNVLECNFCGNLKSDTA
ncbi:putative histone-lysine N-methyltransferase chromatin remodeling SET family [Lupinus albus]|uniref:Putative histone-lysine N-methyltransferase chromatin remodeling SET family n=1 Tax=Lupinus albus TaxID=3870 RepID=A0A6A4QII6_LUPAL|nr:putative histone-lysine N-methyltransferase chromatin remodeling SET family [Lupinus albus]